MPPTACCRPLRDIELADRFNGHFSFTPDGYPMLGESSRVRGLWLAEGIWVTHAGGSAKAVVDLLTTGRSEIDLRQAHPDRFHRVRDHRRVRQGARSPAVPRGVRHHPPAAADAASPRPAHHALPPALRAGRRRADRKRRLGAGAVVCSRTRALPAPEFTQTRSAWAARHWSPTVGREHAATRAGVGVFDLTPFTKVEVEGTGSADWLNRVCASEIDRPVGRIVYTTVLDHAGRHRLRPDRDPAGRGPLPGRHRRRLGARATSPGCATTCPRAAACGCAT